MQIIINFIDNSLCKTWSSRTATKFRQQRHFQR